MSHYRDIFEASPDGILVVDGSGVIVEVNSQAAALFGWSEEELVGSAVERLIPAEARPRHRDHRESYAQHPHPRAMGIGMQLRALRKDGTPVPVEIALSPLPSTDGAGPRVVATVRDVTERIRLRDFGAAALRATEDERKRVAQELHDDTSQNLAALLIRLRLAERDADEATRERIADVRHDLMETSEGIRRIARGLLPPELEEAGLEAALRGRARECRRATGMRVSVDVHAEGALDPVPQLVLYRIVQEALNNTARHALAKTVRVRVGREGDYMVARVEDDGVGFHVAHHDRGSMGMGLMGMRERATSVGGFVTVASEPGKGTTIEARIPIARKESAGV